MNPQVEKKPNFFIVGAPKADTDLLYYELSAHPQIYMSPLKEPSYFCSEVRAVNFDLRLQEKMRNLEDDTATYVRQSTLTPRFSGIITNWPDYLELFKGVTTETAVGEGSVSYLWSATAASSIAALIPDAKFIVVLMDPAERAFAQYLKSFADGNVLHSFTKHLDLCMEGQPSSFGPLHPFLEFGNYATQLKRYFAKFERVQINISFYEEAVADRQTWFAGILQFLSVNWNFELPRGDHDLRILRRSGLVNAVGGRTPRRLKRIVPSSIRTIAKRALSRSAYRMRMSAQERARLVAYYRDEVCELETLLEVNLTAWRT